MKKQADRERKKAEVWKAEDKVMYERFGVQRKTSEEASRPIYWFIYH